MGRALGNITQTHFFLVEDKGEYIGMKEARKHVGWYIKGIKTPKFRNESGLLSTMDDFEVFCANLRRKCKSKI